jgi:glycosyltransferase involved in cell wall biosynthesis
MKIGYWLGDVNINSGGILPYAWRVLESLLLGSKIQEEISILIICSPKLYTNCLELISKSQASAKICMIPSKWNIITRFVSRIGSLVSKVCLRFSISSQLLKHLNYSYRWFSSLDIDLLHIPYQTAPYYDLIYPLLVTMHDVQELHYPEFFTPQERALRAKYYWESLEKSTAVVVSFNHIKQDLIKYFALEADKIHVCSPPYNNIYLHKNSYEEEQNFKKKYITSGRFLLYPAQSWQHKNHLSLIKAIEYIQDRFNVSLNLICTGKKNPNFFPTIENYLHQSKVYNQVYFTDMVSETELYWLYKNCALVVIPTLYEAGSFPLLEAMTLEVPVICSNVTSLPETIGDLRFVFDPLDIDQMADLILQMLASEELCRDNVLNNKKQIELLRQSDSLIDFLNVYRYALNPKIGH